MYTFREISYDFGNFCEIYIILLQIFGILGKNLHNFAFFRMGII